jgi:hypothetical protein
LMTPRVMCKEGGIDHPVTVISAVPVILMLKFMII